jgi:hypothetical protein
MTSDEFRLLMANNTDADLLGPCLNDDFTPYVFGARTDIWNDFRAEISGELGIPAADVRIVGSARLGFSLKPGTNLRRYRDASDVDVIVVSAKLFDYVWVSLLDAAYPRPPATHLVGGWLQQRRDEVYTGWITPLDIRLDRRIFGARAEPVVSFNSRWFNTLKRASRLVIRRHEDITGRLYRTLEHATLYHLNSLATLRKTLASV